MSARLHESRQAWGGEERYDIVLHIEIDCDQAGAQVFWRGYGGGRLLNTIKLGSSQVLETYSHLRPYRSIGKFKLFEVQARAGRVLDEA